MALPFTEQQFFDVFGHYNESVRPMQVVAYLIGAFVIGATLMNRRAAHRLALGGLAFMWLWTGVVYHMRFFSAINRTAMIFGALFVLNGFVLLYAAIRAQVPSFRVRPDLHGITGAAFILYAMIVYPLLGAAFGHQYPASPSFGITPCPLTIFTFGLLIWIGHDAPLSLAILSFIWALIGSTAAVLLGVHEDIGLFVAGIAGLTLILIRRRTRRTRT